MSKWHAYKRHSRGYSDRRVETREPLESLLVICEGEKTEPNYFRSFRAPKDVINIYGVGYNTLALVEKAIELQGDGNYDQVWCVMDRDSFPAKNFNDALALAKRNGIQVAYSNQAFELWYLLHFEYCDTGCSRRDYNRRLTKWLGYKYKKNSETMYEELNSRQADAIRNAQRLLKQYAPQRPHHDNPSTTVHLLVEQLNRFVH